jgi:hypothetical protein
MNKKILTLTSLAIATGALLVSAPSALAYRGDPSVEGPNCTGERQELMTQAFENNDYNLWKEQMQGRGRVVQVVNEANFARFAEMHQLMVEGKADEANVIRAELGLGSRDGSGQQYRGGGNGSGANR